MQLFLVKPFIFATSEIYVAISYCTTFEQITFSSNFAGTLEADVFIEDGFSVSDTITLPF